MSDFNRLINASDLIDWILECYPDWCVGDVRSILDHVYEMPTHPTPSNTLGALDCVDRQQAINIIKDLPKWELLMFHDDDFLNYRDVMSALNDKENLPSVQPEEVIPHRNYKYLSDYWCECGNHLGKKGDVKYCSDCGKKVKWDE